MKRKPALVACVLALSLTSCLHPKVGPQSLPRDRGLYSTGIADSWKQLMLLNIVKTRYLDPPFFVDIGNIVASYTVTQSASASGAITPWNSDSGAGLGVLGTFSNTPTITYTPLTGSKFVQGLTTPLPPAAVFSAIQNGAAADSIMLSAVFSINGLKNQQATLSGITPADPDFDRVRMLMRRIQLSGGVRTFVRQDPNKGPATVIALRNEDLAPEIREDSRELRRLLKLNPDATEFSLVYAPVSSSDTEIAVLTRSIFSLIQNMAAQVEVPDEDLARHRAFPGFEPGGNIPDSGRLIRIHSGKQRPGDAFAAVNYRGAWFWIDDGDLQSKQVFGQLLLLFTMMDTSPRENQPVITIPSR
jgi:hypothetical protein